MRIFWVIKAKNALLCLIGCFAVLLVIYSLNNTAISVFPWGKKQVLFLGHVINPKAPDLEEQVTRLTGTLKQLPIDAEYDSVNKSVLPDLNGFEIDVSETVLKVRSAKNGENIMPAWKETAAAKTLADFPELPIYQGNPVKNQVALIINVSWGNEFLEEMLEILKQERVTASFFLVGRWAEQNPDQVKKIADLGHDFGNHGYSDPHMKDMSPAAIQEEILKTNQIVEDLSGHRLQWFSPPYGEKVEKIYAAAAELGMHTVLWSLDTVDWTLPGEDVIVARIVGNLHNGAVILMHPTEQTPGALRRIIAAIKERDLQAVSVSELLNPSYWPQKYNSLWLGN